MSEAYVTMSWSDHHSRRCHSPSPVVPEWPAPRRSYPIGDFVARSLERLGR
jgi:hypothetical protein